MGPHQGQSSCCREHTGEGWALGCGPRSPKLALSAGQLRAWAIYTSCGERAAGETHMVLWPYLGMAKGTQACQGARGQAAHLPWVSFSLTKSPQAPLNRLQDSCCGSSLQLKILWVVVPLLPESVRHACVRAYTCTRACQAPARDSQTLPQTRVCPLGKGPQTLNHLEGPPPCQGEAGTLSPSTAARAPLRRALPRWT